MSIETASDHALARAVAPPSAEMTPDPLYRRVARRSAAAVRDAYQNENGDSSMQEAAKNVEGRVAFWRGVAVR